MPLSTTITPHATSSPATATDGPRRCPLMFQLATGAPITVLDTSSTNSCTKLKQKDNEIQAIQGQQSPRVSTLSFLHTATTAYSGFVNARGEMIFLKQQGRRN